MKLILSLLILLASTSADAYCVKRNCFVLSGDDDCEEKAELELKQCKQAEQLEQLASEQRRLVSEIASLHQRILVLESRDPSR